MCIEKCIRNWIIKKLKKKIWIEHITRDELNKKTIEKETEKEVWINQADKVMNKSGNEMCANKYNKTKQFIKNGLIKCRRIGKWRRNINEY